MKKIKMYLKCHLNASKDTLHVLDRRLFLKKGIEKQVIHFNSFFFIVFVAYGLRILGYFSKLGEKNKMPLNSYTNGSKDILYVLDKRFFK